MIIINKYKILKINNLNKKNFNNFEKYNIQYLK